MLNFFLALNFCFCFDFIDFIFLCFYYKLHRIVAVMQFLRTEIQCWSLPFFSHFTETILSIRRTPLRRTMDTFETFNGHALTEM